MIKTCSTFLNVRVGSPATSAPTFTFLKPGDAVEVDKTVAGTMLEGNNRWYKGAGEMYYWSGGFEKALSFSFRNLLTADPAKQVLNYNSLLEGIDKKWLSTFGSGTQIAVLDSGFNPTHIDLQKIKVINQKNFITDNEDVTDDSDRGHGSHILGLIGGKFSGAKGIGGLAPAANYHVYKVLPSTEDASVEVLSKAWQDIEANGFPDVVNMSLSISGLEYFSVKSFLDDFTTKTICIVAAGNNEELLADRKGLYALAKHPNVISVGSVSKEFFLQNPDAVFHPRLDFIIPLVDLFSCSNSGSNAYKKLSGCSMATAIVSGITSLLISARPELKTNVGTIRTALKDIALPYHSYLFSTFNLLKP